MLEGIDIATDNVANKYEDAKWAFIKHSVKLPFTESDEYIVNPHEPISYYIIAKEGV